MGHKPSTVEIEATDFKEDPGNDCALAILFDVRGPGLAYEMVTVYFTEAFVEGYFRIGWNKDIAAEEKRLIRDKRDLFLRWAVAKIEAQLKNPQPRESKIILDYATDGIWAKKVETGAILPASKPQSATLFVIG